MGEPGADGLDPSGPDRTRTVNGRPLSAHLAGLHAAWVRLSERRGRDCAHAGRRTPFRQVAANGAVYLYLGCADCQAPTSPGEWLRQDGVDLSQIPVAVDRRTQNPPCVVCGRWGTELHHWAPRHIFGDQADHWPTAWLCKECHAYWHRCLADYWQSAA
jgi:hypothetical protein